MPENPIADKTNEPISASLEYTLSTLREVFRMPRNIDIQMRRFTVSGFACALVYMDGMINMSMVNLDVLEAAMNAGAYEGDATGRIDWLVSTVLTVTSAKIKEELDDIIASVLQGNVALLVDGCASGVDIEAKGFAKRSVDKPVNETVIIGPHEAFTESMKVNITLLRRIIQSPRMVSELHPVGTGIKTNCALLYLDGVANEQMLTEIRRRLEGINFDFVLSAGEVEQLIEDQPFALIPQTVHTERPDRAASFLISGMALLFVEGTPIAIGLPATLLHLLHTPDTTAMRFPAGAFKRALISVGVIGTAFLPALYLALVMFHNEVLPLALITSIYQTQSRVPVPLIFELIFLNIAFDLILEAGARMPGVLAHGLGVVAALILGQAVVAADLVSPLIIIIVAMSGLGSLIVPEYSMTISLRIFQYMLIFAAAIGGLFSLLLAFVLIGVEFCSMTSMGIPMNWVSALKRMRNEDGVSRYPLWQQRVRLYLSNPAQFLRAKGRMRAWENNKEGGNGK